MPSVDCCDCFCLLLMRNNKKINHRLECKRLSKCIYRETFENKAPNRLPEITVAVHADPQTCKERQTKHMITDVCAHTHTLWAYTCTNNQSKTHSSTLSHQFPPPPHILPLLCSFPLPSNTTQNIDTSPPPSSFLPLSLSRPLHHSLSLLNTDRLSTPWSEFQISSASVAEPLQKKKPQQHKGGNCRS